ncbi:MAG: LysM peptidoglycan-binding domain-containing protein [Opitutales bacterium]|nr:LysM peptidoglycan-binding domain-containing protein [Opitutales bacterium]
MKKLLNTTVARNTSLLTVLFALLASALISTSAHAQSTTTTRKQLADLAQRFTELERKYSLLQLEVQNLSAENNKLRKDIAVLKSEQGTKPVDQVVDAKLDRHRKDTETYVKEQYQKVLDMLSSKIENVSTARVVTTTPKTQTTSQKVEFTGTFPKNGVIYTVQSGDNLSKIAKRFGSSVKYIQNANKISNPNNVRIGQELFVPIDE